MDKTKIPLSKAEELANKIVRDLSPFCERIEIAGSIRRKNPEVGDIEIVCIPKITWTADLFGAMSQPRNQLHLHLNTMLLEGWKFIKDGPKYKQVELPQGCNLDLFIITEPAQWGVIFTIRTGPADFSKWIVTQKKYGGALPSNCKVKDGAVWRNGKIVTMPEEDFLKFVGLSGLQPQYRQPNTASTATASPVARGA